MDSTDGTPGGADRPQNPNVQPASWPGPYWRPDNTRPAADLGTPGPAPAAGTPRAGRRRRALLTGALATAAIVGLAATFGVVHGSAVSGTAIAATQVNTDAAAGQPVQPPSGSTGRQSPFGSGGGQFGGGRTFGGGSGQQDLGGSQTAALGSASTAQEVGVVDIDTVLSYEGAEAAGTGLVLTSTGEILTNNHVVEGATSITITIIATGASYPATVLGTDATDDIAVLQLSGASGLTTANIADPSAVAVGDAVTGVGNAGGAGGTPSASPGTVTATDQTITTQAEGSAAAETLNGLIETNADIQAGDSGGPLFNSSDQVVGIDTAAEEGGVTTAGYAIPISSALGIATQIEAGQASPTIVIGYPAFLGVQVSSTQAGSTGGRYRYSVPQTTTGALISGVVSGGPAAQVGLTGGDTIVAIDGTSITDGAALSTTLAADKPGQTVTVTWIDASGSSQSGSVTLASGPAA